MLHTVFMVTCDECLAPSEKFDGAIFTQGEVRKMLREIGWQRTREARIRDLCPKCSGETAKKERA